MRRGWPRAPTQTICNRSDTVVPKSPQRLFEVRARPFSVFPRGGESQGSALIRVSSNLAPFRNSEVERLFLRDIQNTGERRRFPEWALRLRRAHVPVLLCCGGF